MAKTVIKRFKSKWSFVVLIVFVFFHKEYPYTFPCHFSRPREAQKIWFSLLGVLFLKSIVGVVIALKSFKFLIWKIKIDRTLKSLPDVRNSIQHLRGDVSGSAAQIGQGRGAATVSFHIQTALHFTFTSWNRWFLNWNFWIWESRTNFELFACTRTRDGRLL